MGGDFGQEKLSLVYLMIQCIDGWVSGYYRGIVCKIKVF